MRFISNKAPTVNDASVSVAENASIGASVTTGSASDPDVGDYLSYFITAGNTGAAFTIDNSGDITTAAVLDYETTGAYSLTVTVTDVNGLSDTSTVTVTITNIVGDDSDGDTLSDDWEVAYLGDVTTAYCTSDSDSGGQTDVDEYQAGTAPDSEADVLAITEFLPTASNATVKWSSTHTISILG